MNRGTLWSLALIAAGAALVIAAALWPVARDPRTAWSEADAQRRTELGIAVHGLSHEMAHAPGEGKNHDELAGKLDAARREYDEANRDLEDARDRFNRPAWWLRWSGCACLSLGILGFYTLRARTG